MGKEQGNPIEKRLPIPGEHFQVAGHDAFLIRPPDVPAGQPMPWVWYAPTFTGQYPRHEEKWMFERFLARGIAIAGVDVGESYGSPDGRRVFAALYDELVQRRGLSRKACLLARSRGGLMLFNWAAENPESVACIAGIYPVCNIASYPGLAKACHAYHMTEQELAEALPNHNPIDRLAPLAKAKVPIFHIHGDNDAVVPLELNSGEVARRYRALGGEMELEVVTGGGHDLSPHWFQSQSLVDFVIRHAPGAAPAADGVEDLNGVNGKLFHVDLQNKRFELLKETVIDPRTNEGRSRHAVYWTDSTRFNKVVRQNSFAGLEHPVMACFRKLDADNAKAAAEGRPFVVMEVLLLAENDDPADWAGDDHYLVGRFTVDPASEKQRGGTVELNGRPVPVRLRGPQAEVARRTAATAAAIGAGFWETTLYGRRQGDRFVAERMDIAPLVDPRTVDDPNLPRVLVIGDSISMNYHDAAKAALEGIANYYRVEGNAGPSDRGVACAELWLGDHQQKGLHWDLIQFNHGLHDLKQHYDPSTGSYGAYQSTLEAYKANLEKEIAILKKTGAKLMWCSTTPVPNDSNGVWTAPMGRKKDADLIFNQAALDVIRQDPEIRVNDLNAFVRNTAAFDTWRKGSDVHFWGREEQALVGKAVADAVRAALGK